MTPAEANYDHLVEQPDLDHDVVCMMQANQLLTMNCLEYETAAYGTAYFNNDEVYFYISSNEETMRKFRKNAYDNGLYHTPIKYFFQRYDLLVETEEEVKTKFRIEVANRLHDRYPRVFFEALEQLTLSPSLNAAFAISKEIAAQLENSFDTNSLNIFGNLLEMLLEGRLLNHEAYSIMSDWLSNEYEKMTVEPIRHGHYKRSYSGFAYQMPDGTTKYFIDALLYTAEEKHLAFINKGYVVTPILTIQYFADSFDNLQKSRDSFQKEITKYLDANYLKLMQLIKTLPTGIEEAAYQEWAERIKSTGKKDAIAAFQYYGHLWNILK